MYYTWLYYSLSQVWRSFHSITWSSAVTCTFFIFKQSLHAEFIPRCLWAIVAARSSSSGISCSIILSMLSVSIILSLYRGWRVESFFLNLRTVPGNLAPHYRRRIKNMSPFPFLCRFYQGHPTTIFGKISVRKTIWNLEFSEHLL